MAVRESKAPRKKVGLALGSGAARGLAHIGVLEVLEREGIPIDMIAGTSMGAVVGALYAKGYGIEPMKSLVLELTARRLTYFLDPALPKTGLIRGRKIEGTLKSIMADAEFSDLRIPFACVAADIDSGEEVVIKEGLVWEAVRASSSLPVILTVAKWEGRHLVDGGLLNPVPVSIVRAMGADFVIAVNVLSHREVTRTAEPSIFSVIMQTVHISSHRLIQVSLAGADAVIEPEVGHIGYANFHQAEECILEGVRATQALIPEIKSRYSTG